MIFNGAQGWKEITGQDGWEIVTGDARRRDPAKTRTAPKMLLAALQDVAERSCTTRHDAADKIANETAQAAAGHSHGRGRRASGCRWSIQPAWEPATRKSITDMMERAVKAGFYEKMPDEKIIYACLMSGVSRVCPGPGHFRVRLSSRSLIFVGRLGSAVASGAGAGHSAIRDPELRAHRAKHARRSRRSTWSSRWRA